MKLLAKGKLMKRLFIVDDDQDILLSLQIWSQKKGFEVEVFSLPQPLYTALETERPGLILLDVNLDNEDGREIC